MLQIPIVANEQIPNSAWYRKTISFSGLQPHERTRGMVIARINLRTDELHCNMKRLHGVHASCGHGPRTVRPIDLKFARPGCPVFRRRKDSNRDFNIPRSLTERKYTSCNQHVRDLKRQAAESDDLRCSCQGVPQLASNRRRGVRPAQPNCTSIRRLRIEPYSTQESHLAAERQQS